MKSLTIPSDDDNHATFVNTTDAADKLLISNFSE